MRTYSCRTRLCRWARLASARATLGCRDTTHNTIFLGVGALGCTKRQVRLPRTLGLWFRAFRYSVRCRPGQFAGQSCRLLFLGRLLCRVGALLRHSARTLGCFLRKQHWRWARLWCLSRAVVCPAMLFGDWWLGCNRGGFVRFPRPCVVPPLLWRVHRSTRSDGLKWPASSMRLLRPDCPHRNVASPVEKKWALFEAMLHVSMRTTGASVCASRERHLESSTYREVWATFR